MRALLALLLALCCSGIATAQTIPVWPHAAPGSGRWTKPEVTERDTPFGAVAFRVSSPTLTAFLPDRATATGTAVIVAPGGSFRGVTIGLEGESVARWFQRRGVAAFVLKYRVLDHYAPGVSSLPFDSLAQYAIADGIQALRLVRGRATEWGLDPRRVGYVGFSAGGMLAANVLLQPDPAARPSFAVLVYGAPFGAMPRIPSGLPPTLLVWARDDAIARAAMVRFENALRSTSQPPRTIIFDRGGHGFGLKRQGTASDGWADSVFRWIGVSTHPPARSR